MEQERKGLKAFVAVISLLVSIALSAFCGYLSFLKNYWFILPCVYFAFEALFIFIASLIKDEYKAMRVQGVFQIIGVILMMDYLLVMILWNDPNGTMLYLPSYFVFGGAALIKLILTLISHISLKKYNACIHAYRNNDLITFFYLILIIELVIFNHIYPTSILFDFENKTLVTTHLFVYIIEIVTNAILTIFAAFLALSTDITSKERIKLGPFAKIKHTIQWFSDNEVGVYFGTIFTLYLAFLAFMNQKPIYFFLGFFYLALALIRFIIYIWHRSILKDTKGNKIAENRQSSWILLFNAINFFALGIVISIAAIALMAEKVESDTNIYLFLFFIVPFMILRFITAHTSLKKSRTSGDTYQIGVGYISLLSALFSSLEVFAILMHTFAKPVKLTIMIILVIALQIALMVLCITMIVFCVKGRIVNRKSREKR